MTSSDIKYAKRVRAFTEQGVAMLSSPLPPPEKPRKKIGFGVKEKQAAYGRRGVKRKKG
ncbi:MAG: hypothetical protein L6247_08940 [Desulfobacteraceae bacterium]|nr:hypothetical protein [Pseudomonadota bacterium]MBU4463186.1 hypothetical protein [Pseudomonadota bacterium]MCG2755669.1 hypothetical protein [Desulfobacteraceae bacterium]